MKRVSMDPQQTPERYYREMKDAARRYPQDAELLGQLRQLAAGFSAVAGLFSHEVYEQVLKLIQIQDMLLCLMEDQQATAQN